MKKTVLFLLSVLFLIILTGCSQISSLISPNPVSLKVSAVSSLKGPLNELKSIFEDENSNITLLIDYGSSQGITDDIVNGIRPDFFISSSMQNMDTLEKHNLVEEDTLKTLVKNSLVVIAPADSTLDSLESLTGSRVYNIGIGDPDTVSSGHYAVNALMNEDLYDDLRYKLDKESNTSDLIEQVEEKDVQAAFCFKTDAVGNDKVKIIYEFPQSDYSPITYYMAGITGSEDYKSEIKKLEDFLQSDQAQSIFSSYGFTAIMNSSSEDNE